MAWCYTVPCHETSEVNPDLWGLSLCRKWFRINRENRQYNSKFQPSTADARLEAL